MIGEQGFARSNGWLWLQLLPFSEQFVRSLNIGGAEREFLPLKSKSSPSKYALINEIAFELFSENTAGRSGPFDARLAVSRAKSTISKLNRGGIAKRQTVTSNELSEARNLARRYHMALRFVSSRNLKTIVRPRLPGCGFLNEAQGDVLFGRTLIEFKAGDRPFRSIDVRQIVLYLALAHISGSHRIEKIYLSNPRRGLGYLSPVDPFLRAISGSASSDLFREMERVFSSGDVSNIV